MRKPQHRIAALVLLAVAVSCASTGTGDPVVVRAEDMLTNSLTVYSEAMSFHFKHSTEESPAVYKTFEAFRVKFPIAWKALDDAKRNYQKDKGIGTSSLEAGIRALTDLISTVSPLIGGGKP